MQFSKLLDERLEIKSESGLDLTERSYVLSLLNGFENKEWRYSAFHEFIWDNIAETALTKRERDALVGKAHSVLVSAAKNLRLTDKATDIGAGSELAEAVLYGFMKSHYSALPVVPKIFYKQNTQDNAKGADSVHITVSDLGDFSLWFGEAKFYSSIEDARLASIITSVGESLRPDKLKKENAIICNVRDLDDLVLDPELRGKIKAALANGVSIDEIKPRLNVPILLLHACDITKGAEAWSDAYKASMVQFHKDRAKTYLEKQLAALGASVHLYESITFHVILFPVPDKGEVVKRFLKAVEFYKGS